MTADDVVRINQKHIFLYKSHSIRLRIETDFSRKLHFSFFSCTRSHTMNIIIITKMYIRQEPIAAIRSVCMIECERKREEISAAHRKADAAEKTFPIAGALFRWAVPPRIHHRVDFTYARAPEIYKNVSAEAQREREEIENGVESSSS